jgi:hypothetical protein
MLSALAWKTKERKAQVFKLKTSTLFEGRVKNG